MTVDEDEYGTYIMNSKDLCAIDYLKDLIEAGVISFKVEGRNKTEYYASIFARAYRRALDELQAEGKLSQETRNHTLYELSTTANRGFIPGFYARNAKAKAQEMEKDHCVQTHLFAAKLVNYAPETQVAELQVKNRLDKGDELTLISPNQEFTLKLEDFYYKGHPEFLPEGARENQVKVTEHAHGGGQNIFVKMPEALTEGFEHAILRMPYKEAVTLRQRTPAAAEA